MPLTKRQNDILNFIRDYLAEHGYSPALEEIGHHFGIASLNGVYKHLKVLEERGFIRRLMNRARSIQLVEEHGGEKHSLPLLGRIAAGQPIDAISTPEWIDVPENLLTRGNNYVLRVEGDSMIEEHIQDGDLIIVEQRDYASNGETVVALIDGEQATLKKLYREGRQVRLQPANQSLLPIYVDAEKLRVQGVVVGLMRKY
ncbi:MAG: transcriptional repressor LexA [Acidobacteriota bacterium]|nr:MAG: transcriptional repressor LexA [Acidobacteriota bacterium]